MSKLYLVPTPIGNLEDITLRAINVLKNADAILAEDTRTSGVLLKHLGISKPLQSYHIFNEHQTVQRLIQRLLKGETLALVSDAGTPAISDPGFLLVRECIKNKIDVECLPGPTAFVPALVNSGLPSEYFGTDRQASVSRELSKMFEETARGTLQEIIAHFTAKGVKGEIVIVIAGKA